MFRPRLDNRYKGLRDFHFTALRVNLYRKVSRRFSVKLRLRYGCIPVVIADHYWVPFTGALDWAGFAGFVPESEMDSTYERLRAIDAATVARMQRALRDARRHFWPSLEGAFANVLLELWLKQDVCPAEASAREGV